MSDLVQNISIEVDHDKREREREIYRQLKPTSVVRLKKFFFVVIFRFIRNLCFHKKI